MAVIVRNVSASLKRFTPLHAPNLIPKKKKGFCCKMSSESPPLTHSITLPSKPSEPVHIVAAPGVSHSDFWSAIESSLFKQWLHNLQTEKGILANDTMILRQVLIQGVDMFGKRIGFLKFIADIFDKETGKKGLVISHMLVRATHAHIHFLRNPKSSDPRTARCRIFRIHNLSLVHLLSTSSTPNVVSFFYSKINHDQVPGIVFARGPAVAVLILLESEGETYVVLTDQARVPVGRNILELPAGMLDDDKGDIVGTAIREVEEETGIELNVEDMVDLTAFLDSSTGCRVFPSPGGCDEELSIFLCRRSVDKEVITHLQGKETGLREHGELIKVHVVPYNKLWRTTADCKALAAVALLEMAMKDGLLPSLAT